MNPYYSGPSSDHFDGLRFYNLDNVETDRGLGDILRWKLKEKAAAWPSAVPVQMNAPEPSVAGIRVTVVGHASVLIQADGLNVLTDPIWSQRASPLSFAGPKRVMPAGIAFESLPRIDVVLISHNHYDHMDLPTLRKLHAAHNCLVVTPLGNDAILKRAIPGLRIATGDWWERIKVSTTAEVTIVPAYHWSSRTGRDRRMALWCGFMLSTGAGHAYFSGDTGYGNGRVFREIRQRVGRPDMALIPIGSYAPRWFMCSQHTDPEEAVLMLEDLEATRAVGIHWGVFRLTDEPREEPPELLLRALERRGIASTLFPAGIPGQSYAPV